MKAVKLCLFVISLLLIYGCSKNQITSKIEITTTLENENSSNGSPLSFHWYIEVKDADGIEQVTLQFSDPTPPMEFSEIFKKSWSFDAIKEFREEAIPDSWTITVIVRDQDGNISEEVFTLEFQ